MPTLNEETRPDLSPQDRARLVSSALYHTAGFECFNCGWACKSGELVCPNCQTIFASGGKTRRLKDEVVAYQEDQKRVTGEVFVSASQSINFYIDGECVVLPLQASVLVGRISDIISDKQPDIDLGPFKAGEFGVSRQHIRIVRVRESIQVTDLNSSNGTYLNGRRIAPNSSRLLRNGDELQLGSLKIRVAFR